jgi:hypothetical protein
VKNRHTFHELVDKQISRDWNRVSIGSLREGMVHVWERFEKLKSKFFEKPYANAANLSALVELAAICKQIDNDFDLIKTVESREQIDENGRIT